MRNLSAWIPGLLVLFLSTESCTHSPILEEECPPGTVDFTQEILPLIQTNCAMSGCHVGANAAEGIRLTSYSQIMRQVEPGHPEESELFEVLTEQGGKRMPPPPMASLSSAAIERIRLWIQQGAKETHCNSVCDTTAPASWAQVSFVFSSQCVGCHQASLTSGNVRLDTYADAVQAVNDHDVSSAIFGINGAPKMPPNALLSDCHSAIIMRWIQAGMPQ